jgi:hypothetical protein
MDVDGRLREAGQRWRENQGPALGAPRLGTSSEKAPPRRWRIALIPLTASTAAAAMVIGVATEHLFPGEVLRSETDTLDLSTALQHRHCTTTFKGGDRTTAFERGYRAKTLEHGCSATTLGRHVSNPGAERAAGRCLRPSRCGIHRPAGDLGRVQPGVGCHRRGISMLWDHQQRHLRPVLGRGVTSQVRLVHGLPVVDKLDTAQTIRDLADPATTRPGGRTMGSGAGERAEVHCVPGSPRPVKRQGRGLLLRQPLHRDGGAARDRPKPADLACADRNPHRRRVHDGADRFRSHRVLRQAVALRPVGGGRPLGCHTSTSRRDPFRQTPRGNIRPGRFPLRAAYSARPGRPDQTIARRHPYAECLRKDVRQAYNWRDHSIIGWRMTMHIPESPCVIRSALIGMSGSSPGLASRGQATRQGQEQPPDGWCLLAAAWFRRSPARSHAATYVGIRSSSVMSASWISWPAVPLTLTGDP